MSNVTIPEGYHAVTPYLVLEDPAEAIHYMKQVLDATEILAPMHREDGTIMHAEMLVGNSPIMLGGATSEWPRLPAMLYVYVADADEAYRKAMELGGVSLMEPTDQPHGDRYSMVRDTQGNQWCMAQVLEKVSEEELRARYGQS